MGYKNIKSKEERTEEGLKIRNKYPDRIPCILEKLDENNNNSIPTIDKNKYLLPDNLVLSQFLYVIRKRLKLSPDKALFVFCNGKILLNQSLMIDIYKQNKDEDHYLYLHYSGESTFG